ncbi:Hypoxia up-regulated protein 1 [Trachymyrmex septentrionalis]|uniref:Hypoxia up-regulated protein 1 n=2 Tax=Trachymyrmex septentrionalis TaxID=34720 RepID=A0A195ET77_9HYME|nr:PREDICTED: hypoxia up-regulated protein 1 isoform X2 [Trachymyrmex septentrionalis]KYN31455.1 Hypoxia up-regulated protein 1 [Trachymyrmex septentrionalis]
MGFSQRGMSMASLALLIITTFVGISEELAVMSIDLGSEWMKVAIVSPGVPMEIALNKESKRKTPVTIAFRDGERSFGEDAQVIGVRFPQNTFFYILDLLGKPIDNPLVQLYRERFPYYNIIADDERKTVAFRLNENTTYTPEELLAQILHKGKEIAEASAHQKINEAVITVPGFFNQAERKALIQAAELAGLKVLQLINDYMAVALNYGVFGRTEINDSAHYIMFYDMGASSTTATVVSYQNVKTKERGFVETNPHVTVLGVGYDRTLGGLEMQIRLQHYLAQEFDALKKTPNSVFKNPRAMAKLFKEAGRVKTVLSANADHFAQIESLIDDIDFKLQVSREKLEEICADLFERVANPVKVALETSGLTMDIISHVVLVGAGTRMPKVQETLSQYVNTELSKNVNTDEAAALGAAYKAADLSQGFKVKKFVTKDALLFPIQITFDRTVDNKVRQVKKTLFGRMNPFPQKKIITFNKHTNNFDFHVNYAELDYLPASEVISIGNLHLSTISLSGVAEALEKHANEGAESKGIKVHFNIDDSGVLNLLTVELVSEKSSTVDEEEGTFSILGSTISKFFAGSSLEKETVEKTEEPPKEDIKPVHEEPEFSESTKETDEKEKKKSETKVNEEKTANKTEKADKEKKATIVQIKEPISSKEVKLGSQILSDEKLTETRDKIHRLDVHDSEKARRETALNNLESYVIDAQQKFDSKEFSDAATDKEIEEIRKACTEISEWLYEDGFTATAEVYEEKLMELQKLTNDVYERVSEYRDRPEVLNGMVSLLKGSRLFLENMRNLSLTSEVITSVEIETLEKAINETQDYYDMVSKYFADAPLNIPVKYKIRQIVNKMDLLDREIKYLLNKVKIWKPKQETTANQTTDSKAERTIEENNESSTDSNTKNDKSAEEQPSDNIEDQQQEPISETTDTTQDPLQLPESEKPLTKEEVQKETHHEL